jgi:hypothetical protein
MTRFARFRSGGANRGRRPSGTTVQIRFCSSGLAYLNRDTLAHGSVQHLALSSRQARRELSANSWSAIQRLVRHPRAAIDLSHTTVLTPDLRAWRVAFRQISVGEVEYPSSPRRTLARRFLRKNAPIAGRQSNGPSGSAKPHRSTRWARLTANARALQPQCTGIQRHSRSWQLGQNRPNIEAQSRTLRR